MARVDRAAKGGEGPAVGGNRCRCAQTGLLFQPTIPACLLQRFQRWRHPWRQSRSGQRLHWHSETPKTLTEYDAVALELVRNTRCSLKPARVSDLASRFQQLTPTMSRKRLRWPLRARALAAAVPRTVARRVAR